MITFEEAFAWLNRLSGGNSYLSETIIRLFQNIEDAFDAGDYPKVIYYIEVIKDIGRRISRGEDVLLGDVRLAEMYLRCGRAFYRLHDYRSAINDFRKAISYYQQGGTRIRFNRAIAGWLLGWAFWHISKQSDAIAEWDVSTQILEEMMNEPDFRNFSEHRAWCDTVHQRMSTAIYMAIDDVHVGRWPDDR